MRLVLPLCGAARPIAWCATRFTLKLCRNRVGPALGRRHETPHHPSVDFAK